LVLNKRVIDGNAEKKNLLPWNGYKKEQSKLSELNSNVIRIGTNYYPRLRSLQENFAHTNDAKCYSCGTINLSV
jgi:hypothetical protein